MKLKNHELLNFINLQIGNKRLPVKLTFAIAANIEEVNGKIKAFEEAREKLIDKYVKKDEDGEPIIEGTKYVFDDPVKWSEDIQELLEMEVEANIITVKLEDIAKCDEAEFDSLTVNEVSVIKFMIESQGKEG